MIRILIADSSEISRKHLRVILGHQTEWTICGETGNGLKAVLMACELKPDLVILDLVLPMVDGFRAAAEIAKILPSLPIVIYSAQIIPGMEVGAKEFGVWAMVPKSGDGKPLIETLVRLLPRDTHSGVELDPNSTMMTEGSSEQPIEPKPKPPPEPD